MPVGLAGDDGCASSPSEVIEPAAERARASKRSAVLGEADSSDLPTPGGGRSKTEPE